MSLILDALKKAETERNGAQPVPDITTDHSATEDQFSGGSKSIWPWLTAGSLILLFVFGLGWYLFSSDDHTVAPVPQEIISDSKSVELTEPSASLPNSEKENSAATAVSDGGASDASETTQIATIDKAIEKSKQQSIAAKQELIKSQYESSEPSNKTNKDNDKAGGEQTNKIDQLYADVNKNGNSADSNTAKNNAAKANESQNLSANNRSNTGSSNVSKQTTSNASSNAQEKNTSVNTESLEAYSGVKLIKELPFSAQEKVPTMMYTEHNYEGKTGSTVVINGKKLREGSTVQSGIKVEQILENGVVLKQNQYQFKMWALNSWLNY